MRHVLWIGGPPGSGKTTIAKRLARRYGARLYSADARTWAHRDRALAAGHPAAARWEALSPEQRWEGSTPAEMLEMSLHRERGQMVVDDVRALPRAPLVVAEGSTVPPWLVVSGLAVASQVVWLMPTAAFQERQLAARGTAAGAAALYRLLGGAIDRDAHEEGLPTLAVDGGRGIAEMVDAVEGRFGDVLRSGPVASTLGERRGLLREVNEAIVLQVCGYHARPWAEGDANAVVRAFVCECGDRECLAELELTVGEASAGPVLAPGHG